MDRNEEKSSVSPVLVELNQAFEDVSSEAGRVEKESLHLEQKLYNGVASTSLWLDGVEEQVFVATALLPEEETETYLFSCQRNQRHNREMDKNKNLFTQIFPEKCSNQEKPSDERKAQEIMTFKNDLKLLFTSLADSKYLVLQKLAEAAEKPETEQIQVIMQAEESLKELDDMYDEVMMIIGSRRSDLNQNLALKRQYERALQDLADLVETGQEKMDGDQKMIVASKEEVQSLLDKHKVRNCGLESHMILTETLFRKMSSFALLKETQSHSELIAQASTVLKLAHKRGVELEYILETWMHLDEAYQELTRQLESVEGNIPAVGLVEETEDKLTERIKLFQHLRSNLTEYQPKLYQVLDDGKRLLFSVSCSDLEKIFCTEYWEPAPQIEEGRYSSVACRIVPD
uniref:Uncharacterized protein n=1 Tax=Gallus gallus TaxID=9031 RepID=A0A8V0XM53_CHICK